VVVDERKPSLGDHNSPRAGLAAIERFRTNRRFRLVYSTDGVLIFRRR